MIALNKVIFVGALTLVLVYCLMTSISFIYAISGIEGYVTNIEGTKYIPGVNVSVYNATTGAFITSNLTNASAATCTELTDPGCGYYSFPGLTSDDYILNFTATSYILRTSGNVTAPAEYNTSLYFSCKGSYNYTVLDYWNNRPIPNATVTVKWGSKTHSGTTDSNGHVIIEVPANSTCYQDGVSHNFTVSASGYYTNITVTGKSINEGQNEDVTIYMKGSACLQGYVKDEYRYSSPGINNALVDLWNEDNTSKINISDIYFYNTTTDSNGYYSICFPNTESRDLYIHTTASGYISNTNTFATGRSSTKNISLTGSAVVNGSVFDKNNQSYAVQNAIIRLRKDGDIIYQTTTDSSGYFSVSVRNSEGHNITITKTGYYDYSNDTTYTTNIYYGRINLTGDGTLTGTLVDYQNNTIRLNNVNVTITVQTTGPRYSTTTDSSGYFILNISSEPDYTITFAKEGYDIKSSSFSINSEETKDLGTITMTGSKNVYGYAYDSSNMQDTTINNATITVTSGSNGYKVYTNSAGYYSLYIPSTLSIYTVRFNKAGYNISQKIGNPDSSAINAYLTGSTYVSGNVTDRYNLKPIENTLIEFYNPATGTTYYNTSTNSSGDYSINIGVDFNYSMRVTKSGYQSFTNGTYTWDIDRIGVGDDNNRNILLNGSYTIYIKTIDTYDGAALDNARICIMYNPPECTYSDGLTTNENGTINFNIEEKPYRIKITRNGYLQYIPTGYYESNFSKTINMTAHAQIYVYDKYAINHKQVPYATVVTYVSYNNTNLSYTLNETIVNVTITCNGNQRNGVNVSLVGVHYSYEYSALTAGGERNVTFRRVPIGRQNLAIDGSSVDCGSKTDVLNITTAGITYQYTYDMDSEAPKYFYQNQSNDTVGQNEVINLTVFWTDNSELSIAWLSTNETGSYINNSLADAISLSGNESWSNFSFTPSNLGGKHVGWRVYANDTAGNINVTPIMAFIVNDTAGPAVFIQSPSNTSYSTSTIEFNVTAEDAGNETDTCFVEYSGVNYTMTNTTGNWNYTNTTIEDGAHYALFYCNDSLGNVNNTEDVYFTVDTTVPSVTIQSPTNTTYITSSIEFNVTTEDATNETQTCLVEYSSVNHSLTNSTGNWHHENTTVPSGTYHAIFYCNDSIGNMNNSENVYFTVEVTAPSITLSFPDDDSWNTFSTINFGFTPTTNDDYENCSVWGNFSGSWAVNDTNTSVITNNTVNVIASTLSDGYWLWNIQCCDSLGNCGQTGSNRTLKVDTVRPNITIDSPANLSYPSIIALSVSADETIDTWWYEYNSNGTNITFTPNTTFIASGSDGAKHIDVYANDSAGNKNYTRAWFTLETEAPNITLNFPDDESSNASNSINFGFTPTTNDDYENCSVWSNFSGTWTVNDTNTSVINNNTVNVIASTISDGYWLWNIQCCDSTGNCNFSITNRTLIIDTVTPGMVIYSPSNTTYNSTSINLSVSANENINAWLYQYASNGTNLTFTPNTTFVASGSDGAKHIDVYANDSAGNKNSSNVYFTVDTTAPSVNIQSPNNTTYTVSNIEFNVTAEDMNETNSCVVEYGGVNHSLTNSTGNWHHENTTVPSGTYHVVFYCNDSIGNMNSTEDVYFTVELIAPSITLNFPVEGTWNTSSTINFGFTPNTNDDYENCSVWSNFSGSWAVNDTNTSVITNNSVNTIASTFSDGHWLWNIQCCDSLGNCGQAGSNRTIKIDSVRPLIVVSSPTNSTYSSTVIDLNVSTDETIDTWWYEYNSNGTNITFTPNTTFVASGSDGAKYIDVYANDSAGNKNYTRVWFTLDTTAPGVTIQSPSNTTYSTSNIEFNVTSEDVINETQTCLVEYSSVNHTLTNSTGNWHHENTTVDNGTYLATFYCNDTLGHTNISTIYFTVDIGAPVTPIINSVSISPDPQGFGLNTTIEANITDANGQDDIDTVFIGITPPNGSEINYTMNNVSSELWHYNYSNWTIGAYDCIIYVNDSSALSVKSDTENFNLHINLTIDVKTHKGIYGADEIVNLTTLARIWTDSTDIFATSTYEGGNEVAVDSQNNVYVVGTCYDYGSSRAICTAKFNSTGDLQWSNITDPTLSWDEGRAVAVDGQDNVYVGGYCRGCGDVGNDAMYLFKLNSTGDLQWTNITDPSSSGDYVLGIVTDSQDNVYVTGYCYECGSSGGTAIYTFKLNSTGDFQWRNITDPSSSNDMGLAVTIDSQDNVYVTGYCYGCGSNGNYAIYTMKFDSNGTFKWTNITDPSSSSDEGLGIVTDSQDNVYVTGFCYGCGGSGNYAIYTFKLNSTGDYQWTDITDPSTSIDEGRGVVINSQDNVYVMGYCSACGSSNGEAFYTIRFDPDGNKHWINISDIDTAVEIEAGLAIDNEDNLYITGVCENCGSSGLFYTIKFTELSIVKNIYTTNTSLYMLIKVQYWNSTLGTWIDDDIVINDSVSRRLNVDDSIKPSDLFNGKWSTSVNASYGDGTYRIWAAAVDNGGNILKNVDGENITSTYNFTVDISRPTIILASPENTTYTTTSIDLNVSADETINTWWYEYNSNGTNITFTPNTTFVASGSDGAKHINVYANDSIGNKNYTRVWFTLDTAIPAINSVSNTPELQGFGLNVTIMTNITHELGQSDIDTVLVGVTIPGESEINYTMINDSIDTWFYNYTDWTNGTYTYVIYVNDTSGSLVASSSDNFNMYINFTIHVRTLKDVYGDEYVNLAPLIALWSESTDPSSGYDTGWDITTDTNDNSIITGYCNGCGSTGGYAIHTAKINSSGQTEWTYTRDRTSSSDRSYGVATDSNDSIYVVGYCDGCGATGSYAMYVFKINSTGSFKWEDITDPTSDYDILYDVATDSNDNVYVVGYCDGCGSQGQEAIYTMKYDSDGNKLWTDITDPNTYYDVGYGITVDSQDNVIITGYESPGPGVGPNWKIYTVKFDSDGNFQWADSTDPYTSTDSGYAVTTDSQDNIYVAGHCYGCGATMSYAIYVIKLDSDGNSKWTYTNDYTSESDSGRGIVTDSKDNIYVAGYTSIDDREAIFLMKLNSSGVFKWISVSNPTTSDDSAEGLAIDSEDNLYLGGYCGTGCGGTGGYSLYTLKYGFPCKLRNTGNTNTSIYILIKIQYWNSTLASWVDDDIIHNDSVSRLLNTSDYIELSNFSYDKWKTSVNASYGDGTYRVWASAVDNEGTVLKDVDGNNVTSTYNFTVELNVPTITISVPDNTTYSTTTINLNASADESINTWWYEYNSNGTNITFTPNTVFVVSDSNGAKHIDVYANDSSGNENYTRAWFTVQGVASLANPQLNVIDEKEEFEETIQTSFTVSVKDTEGNVVGLNSNDNGTEIELYNSTNSWMLTANKKGSVTFDTISPGTYSLNVNGTWQGYGKSKNDNIEIVLGDNSMIVVLTETTLTANITDQNGNPVGGAVVILYNNTEVSDEFKSRNAEGEYVEGITESNGLITFSRVLPCYNCNLTVNKLGASPKFNSTLVDVKPGVSNIAHIDPYSVIPGLFEDEYTLNFTINNGDSNADNINITVLINQTGRDIGSNLTVDGNAVIYNVSPAYYDIIINGSTVGFADLIISDIPIGKLVMNNGTTDTNGLATLIVKGTVDYYVYITVGGYYVHDDLTTNTVRNGSYDSTESPGTGVKPPIYANLTGRTRLTGYAEDGNFYEPINPPLGIGYEPAPSATINIYKTSDCAGGLIEDNLRYRTTSTSNGSYALSISPRQRMSPSSNQTYCVKTTASGFVVGNDGPFENLKYGTENRNIGLTGNSTVSGYVKDILTTNVIEGADILLISNECYGSSLSSCNAYRTTTNSDGFFVFNVNPTNGTIEYIPYTIRISKENYNKTQETISTIPNENGIYYLNPSGNAFIKINVTTDLGETMTDSVAIKLDDNILNSSTTGCYLASNVLTCSVNMGSYLLTVNASSLGYGINTSYFSITDGEIKVFDIILNSTTVNITLRSDDNEILNGVTVTLSGASLQNETGTDGSAVFSNVLAGSYNITFSGDKTEIYVYNSTNRANFTLTESMYGLTTNLNYILNETRFLLNMTNETGRDINGISVLLTNTRTANKLSRTIFNDSSLILNFHFDEATGNKTEDFSGYGNNGTIYNATWTDGKLNYALNFDGVDDHVNASTPGNTSNFTLEAWIKASNTSSSNQWIIGDGSGLSRLYLDNNTLQFYGWNGTELLGTYCNFSYTDWKHIIATITSTSVEIYINGQLVKNKTISTDPVIFITGALIGYHSNTNGRYFNGKIDSVKIYNRSLNSFEVKALYLSQFESRNGLFTKTEYGNYTLTFNETQVYELGYIPVSQTLEVLPGHDENTSNRFNITLNDIEIVFNITNTTGGGLENINITLFLNNSLAENTYNQSLTGLTNANGILTFHNVIPTAYVDSSYTYRIDANSTGYGILTTSITVGLNGTNVTKTLSPLTLNITVQDVYGNRTNTNVSITGPSTQSNETTNGVAIFSALPIGVYNIGADAIAGYWSKNETQNVTSGVYNVTLAVVENGKWYFNFTVSPSDSSVTVHQNSTDITNNVTVTSINNRRIIELNVSLYNNSISVTVSRSGYISTVSSVTDYNSSERIVNLGLISLSPSPSGPSTGPGGVPSGPPALVTVPCSEDWNCTKWSKCINGVQTRTCTDLNECDTKTDKPDETRVCVISLHLEMPDIYLNANDCVINYLLLNNTGNTDISNISVNEITITDCCSIIEHRISVLMPDEMRRMQIKVCAPKLAKKGEYEDELVLVADEITKNIPINIYVMKNYADILFEEIAELTSELNKIDKSKLGAKKTEYYNLAEQLLEYAKKSVIDLKYDDAERMIEQVKDYLAKIKAAEEPFNWWLIVLAVPTTVFLIFFARWFIRRRGALYKPSDYYPAPASYNKQLLLNEIEKLNKRISTINTKKLGQLEKYYYERVKDTLNNVKNHILSDNFAAAKNALSEAESHIKVLESKLFSISASDADM